MERSIRLTLLGGVLAGRSLELRAGEFSLGSGEADVLVPLDSGIEKIMLFVEERGVVSKGGVPCWINGIPVEYTPDRLLGFVLPEGKAIDLAGQGLVLTRPEKRVQFTQLPARQGLKKRGRMRLRFSFKLFLLAMLLGAGLWGWIWAPFPRSVPLPSITVQAWLQAQTARPEFAQVTFTWKTPSTLCVEGRCRSSALIKPLLQKVRQRRVVVQDRLLCDDGLVESVYYALQLFGFDQVKVLPGGTLGCVEIVGQVRGDQRWQNVVEMLTALPGLREWRVMNPTTHQMKMVVDRLTLHQLLDKLTLTESNGKFLLTGLLEAPQQQLLQALIDELHTLWGSSDRLIFQNIESYTPQSTLLPAPIMSLGGSAIAPFIELSNGLRLQVGSKLPSGYEISHIDTVTGVGLVKQGQRVLLPIDL